MSKKPCTEMVSVGDEEESSLLVCSLAGNHDGLHWDGIDDISWIQGKLDE